MLNDDQLNAFTSISSLFANGENVVLLTGNAGTGKTYLVGEMVRCEKGLTVCAAPTNKAVSVIKEKVGNARNADFRTVHSLLCMKKMFDDDGNVTYGISDINKAREGMDAYDMIVVDEASMMSSELMRLLHDNYYRRILYVGDDKQLNPVNETDSPVFTSDIPEVRLTKIVRQAEGNPIIMLSQNVELIANRESMMDGDRGYAFTYDRDRIVERLASDMSVKYLAWTNECVNKMNFDVRNALHGQNAPRVVDGEVIILDEMYRDIWYTNEEVVVENVKDRVVKFEVACPRSLRGYFKEDMSQYDIPVHVINGKGMTWTYEGELPYRKAERKMIAVCRKSPTLWKHYFAFREMFMRFKYGYAMTVHKSQGSTYRSVIVDVGDILRNPNRKECHRMLYTAVTRASDKLILYNVRRFQL